MKKIISAVLFAALALNLILLHALTGVQKDLHGMAAHVQKMDELQGKLLERMKPVEQFASLTSEMNGQLSFSMKNTQKMQMISQDIQKKNSRMLSEETAIDGLVKDVVALLPVAASDSRKFLQNTKDLKTLMEELQKTQNEVLELQTAMLKTTRRKHRLLKKIPDSGGFFF